MEQNKYVGLVSTNIQVSLSKDGDFPSYFDKTRDENFDDKILKELLIENHTIQDNNVEILDQLALERILGFLKHLKK